MKLTSPEAALHFLAARNPFDNVHQSQYAAMLMNLQDKKGDEAIEALAGFYVYAIDKIGGSEGSHAIETTFAHDLAEANDEFSLPRSSSYTKFWQEEYSRRKYY